MPKEEHATHQQIPHFITYTQLAKITKTCQQRHGRQRSATNSLKGNVEVSLGFDYVHQVDNIAVVQLLEDVDLTLCVQTYNEKHRNIIKGFA